ncbi:hypothetical protein JDV02_003819 [Purpureocillium takamizusanense]|uniref:CFEM domain-containing protein n=1 Tax=Purpureocillium takamizusanense TaxID=2060973 RepID=A0A9Q8V989_9HYPO|nr:uncharacterized protein JDV02_003819 [Purpureocillium takamizusanense]UNI17478.1 hypothetical protein JDV02_003819 [Purpureocillium takamizusanense]
MKPSAAAVLAAILAPMVAAQSRSDIPKCALPCIDASIKKNTKCATDDFACICRSVDAIRRDSDNVGCVLRECGQSVALNEVIPATQRLCSQSGSGGGTSSPSGTRGTASPSATATAGAASLGFHVVSGPIVVALGALVL